MTAAANILNYISQNGIKQSYLAKKLNIHPVQLNQILHERTFLKLEVYVAITEILGVPVDYFIDDGENEQIQLEISEVEDAGNKRNAL